ncbi:hypothetical protein BDBG_06817 [Blastomyces gilchristii SLH14081]|uniref:Uncharacterized protein n=1 Tax=Blastomyces gilchristii (strain SLH14081) TaxID=559298 RepID=A0A179UW32_BLAGS|nr:uncharacterized protein BDBG_06817 [Blastomyces gilchristii SLH14081]OAT11297.1 hypothetical protein BDBG_06817 [Blastomyces gilchristii SLH14081]
MKFMVPAASLVNIKFSDRSLLISHSGPATRSYKENISKRPESSDTLDALISINEDLTYKGFCTQLWTLNDCLTKLKSIQNSDRRYYISVTHTSALKNNNNDADVMN